MNPVLTLKTWCSHLVSPALIFGVTLGILDLVQPS